MRQNYETCLISSRVALVPYRPEHVPKYHEWMKDPDLLEATGSEPLSFEEECQMQQSWRDDDSKCTFIVHMCCEDSATSGKGICGSNSFEPFYVKDHLHEMIGDVNLFLSVIEDDDDDDDDYGTGQKLSKIQGQVDSAAGSGPEEKRIQAEIDIMIAEKSFRGQGLGRAAVCAMLLYGYNQLKVHRFFCKINEDNVGSIKLFESVGFKQCNYAACFKQVEMELLLLRSSSSEGSEIAERTQINATEPDSFIERCRSFGGEYQSIPCPLNSCSDISTLQCT